MAIQTGPRCQRWRVSRVWNRTVSSGWSGLTATPAGSTSARVDARSRHSMGAAGRACWMGARPASGAGGAEVAALRQRSRASPTEAEPVASGPQANGAKRRARLAGSPDPGSRQRHCRRRRGTERLRLPSKPTAGRERLPLPCPPCLAESGSGSRPRRNDQRPSCVRRRVGFGWRSIAGGRWRSGIRGAAGSSSASCRCSRSSKAS